MNFKLEIKTLLLLAAILTAAFALSAQSRQVELSPNPNRAALRNNSDLGFDVNYTVGELKIMEVQTKEGTFDELSIEGWGFSTEVGEPKLPMLRRMISVPLGAEVRLTLNSPQMRELDSKVSTLQNRIIPAQAPISKAATTIPFVVNEALYRKDAFNSREWVEISELGFMRGVRLFALDFYPVRYNPVTNSIRVLENLDLRVDFVNPDLGATADLQARTASWEFERLYANTIFNWDTTNRTSLVRQPTKMVILCPVGYINNGNLQNYVTWKTQQGFAVSVVSVGSGGTVANTTTAIKNYMQNLWNNATPQNPAPTYLLIIGDESGTNSIVSNTGATGSHVTDLTYVRLQGSDYMPEMYYGRFSVSSATELGNIINKTITFEKTQMQDLSYLGKTVLIAGVDARFAPTHGNGAIRYADTEYFNDSHGITSNTYLYPTSGSSATQIRANANEGRGYMVYTAHGSEISWADPEFNTSHVNAMTNSGKYGVMVGNCCITNKFNYSNAPCFGEAVIRKANGGGVAYIGGTNNTYWDEDYYWAVGYKPGPDGNAPLYNANRLGAYDAMFHSHGEPYSKWATTISETVYSGNLAVVQSNSSLRNYYWEIYHIMGDPSLMPYMGIPTANPASYLSQIIVGRTNYIITGAAPYTRVGLTKDGVIHGSGITDAFGNLSLTITPFTSTGTAKLVLTAQNRITKTANINVVANAGGPIIEVIPATLDYGDVVVGSTEVKTFTIQNSGDQVLTGSITTPVGYTVAEANRFSEDGKAGRNSLNFSVNAGTGKSYTLTFSPSAVNAYNGNIAIPNNSLNQTNASITVNGMGYIPPTVSVSNSVISANLQVETVGTESFTITNTGSKPLSFNIKTQELSSKASKVLHADSGQDKSVAGSTLTLNTSNYQAGTTANWTFTVYNGSTDSEWLQDVIITFPAGVTVNSVTNFVGGSGPLTPDVTSGNGVTINWHGQTTSGWGVIQGGQSATATVNVSIAPSFTGNLTLPWTVVGDYYYYSSTPHALSGSIVLNEYIVPINWLSIQPLSGNLSGGETITITANFSAVGMAVGTYQALLTIYSNDPVNPSMNVNANLRVWDGPVPDIITGVTYNATNVSGATFVSNHDLFIVPGVDENTPAMADLPNLDPATSHIAGYTGGDNNVTLTFNITTVGDWYLVGYWGGSWHQATPFPLTVSSGSGTITLSGIDFTAKGDVYVVLSPDNNPTLPVELSHFSATLTAENYVQLTWTSQTESNLLGYNVYRNDASDLSSALKVSELIEGTNTSIAQTYIYVDEELQQDGTYYYWLQNVDMDGTVGFHGPASVVYSTGGGPGAPPIPLVTRLENAYPNPFNPDTTIRYQLKDPAQVRIDIYNLKGQIVRSFSQSHDAPGYYKLNWDGCDGSGRALSSGVYLYKMSAGSYQAAKKLVLKK